MNGRTSAWARRAALGAVLAAAAVPARGGEENRLTVKRIWEGPPIASPIPDWEWRPGHEDLVLHRGDREHRSLVAMDPETGAERELLSITSLAALAPEGKTPMRGIGRAGPPEIRWARSGDALVVSVNGDLVWVDLVSGARRRLTHTTSPISDVQVSPDAAWVSFSRDADLWAVPTAGGDEVRLTTGGSDDVLNATLDWVYPEELDFDTAAWWSPDAKRVAFLRLDETGVPKYPLPSSLARDGEVEFQRYPKPGEKNPVPRVGVVGTSGGDPVWLDLGSPAPEYVVRAQWFPDGKRVAVATLDRAQRRLRLLACDAATGASTPILEETDAAWVDAPPPPRFLDDRRFLWRSRRDDATRWWLVTLPEGGGPPTEVPVTPPDVDAEEILDVDPKKEAVLFSGTPRGDVRSAVFVSAAGTEKAVRAPFLRDGDLHVHAAVNSGAGLAIVTSSASVVPTRREVRRIADGKVVRLLGDASSPELSALRFAVPEFGTLETPEGRLPWRLWKPADLDPAKRYPVIVQVYGGPGSRTVRDEWGRGPFFPTLLTEHGFLVFEIDGRGTGGRGAKFERLVQGRLGLLELDDQVRGVEMLKQRPYVDGARVGIWGWSYGGTMTCNALCRRSDVFRSGFAVAPVTDWRNYDTIYTERYMGTPQQNPKGYQETSIVRAAAGMGGRLLILHGLGDDNVHAVNTFQLVDALLKAKRTGFEVMVYPESAHGLSGRHADVFERLLTWFERTLRAD